MFRIRRIYDDITPANKEAIHQVQQILKSQFSDLSEGTIKQLPDELRNPFKFKFRSILFVADDAKGKVKGFAIVHHAPDLHFCYLDFLSADQSITGRGIGGALYQSAREAIEQFNPVGLFFECLPDDPALCKDVTALKLNRARLRFYERFGAYPIINTAYETPIPPDSNCPPYLVYDDLGRNEPLSLSTVRPIVRAILERKYGKVCSQNYIDRVVNSFTNDPVKLRGPKYVKNKKRQPAVISAKQVRIALVINDKHEIHHVHERGYVESPVRIKTILNDIEPTGLYDIYPPRHFGEQHILAVHDATFVKYLKKVCSIVPANKSIYPYVFPIRNPSRPPKELPVRAGYYCIDTFTPLNSNAYKAAVRAVDCALTAADLILHGHSMAYALVRPPGHHAERSVFGGFCYLNTNAIAAHFLSKHGRVAILDIDYHHGNGQQEIFYQRSDVLTISIHGHPRFAYPYFSGFAEEKGAGYGLGYNINFPLPEKIDDNQYGLTLQKALRHIRSFKADFIVVAFGLDTARGDPTGTWNLTAEHFEDNGRKIGSLGLPVLVVQEGGYRIRTLGINARRFFTGLWQAYHSFHETRTLYGN